MMGNGALSGQYQGFYRRTPPQVQSKEAKGCSREKGGWQAVNGTKSESGGLVYMTLKELCARDCLCSSTQLQMSLGFLHLSPPLLLSLPSLWLTLSLLLSHFFFVFLSFFLSLLNEKEFVWQGLATNSTWPQHCHNSRKFDQTKRVGALKLVGANSKSFNKEKIN